MFNLMIRTRLSIYFTIVVAIILAIFMIATYYYVRLWRSEEFNSKLLTNAVATAAIVLRSDNLSPKTLLPFKQQMIKTLPYERITIFNNHGKSVFHSGDTLMNLTEFEQEQAMKQGRYVVTTSDSSIGSLTEFEHSQAVKNGRYAIKTGDTQKVIIPFLDENNIHSPTTVADTLNSGIPVIGTYEYIVAISAIDKDGITELRILRLWFIISFGVALVLVFAAGIFFARQAMAPINNIRRKAENITASDLHIRIDEGKRKDELAHLAHAFNVMLDRLEAAFKLQKQFVSNASHEMRTPLTTIAGQLDVLLLRSRTEEEYRSTVMTVLDSTRQLNRLVNNLLLLARTESELLKPVRIDEVLFGSLDETKQRHNKRAVEMKILVPTEQEGNLMLYGNEELLKVAFINVLDNAMKYSDPSSTIAITIDANKPNKLTVIVKDCGIGIPEDDIDMIFQPFFRTNSATGVPGNGIGLTLVKAIIDRHNGTISLKSIVGNGTIVEMSLPTII